MTDFGAKGGKGSGSHLCLEAGRLILVLLQLPVHLAHLHLGLVVLVIQLLQLDLHAINQHKAKERKLWEGLQLKSQCHKCLT